MASAASSDVKPIASSNPTIPLAAAAATAVPAGNPPGGMLLVSDYANTPPGAFGSGTIGQQIRFALTNALIIDAGRAGAGGLAVPPLIELIAQYLGDGLHSVNVDEMRAVMGCPDRVRNVAFIGAHNTGKSLLVDGLVCASGIASKDGDTRFMDTRDRSKLDDSNTTRRAIPASLYFLMETAADGRRRMAGADSKCDSSLLASGAVAPFLINLIDTPGATDRSAEATLSLRVADGAVVVVDATEGVAVSTETNLRSCMAERVKPCVFLTYFDKLLLPAADAVAAAAAASAVDTKSQSSAGSSGSGSGGVPNGETVYQMCLRTIESCNVVIATYRDELMGDDVQANPSDGRVAFGSSVDGWGFTLDKFASLYVAKFGIPKAQLMKRLWGDSFFNTATKKWSDRMTTDTGAVCERGFVMLVHQPISTLMQAVMSGNKTAYTTIVSKLGLTFPPAAHGLAGRPLLKALMQCWLPACDAVLELIVNQLPSPKVAQKYRVENLYAGPMDDEPARAIRNCDEKGPLMMCVIRMIPTSEKNRFYGFGRVFSGVVSGDQTVRILGPDYLPGKKRDLYEKKIRRTVLMMGRFAETLASVPAGNFVSLVGVDQYLLAAGTITTAAEAHTFVTPRSSQAGALSVAVDVVNATDLPRLMEALKRCNKIDPLVSAHTSATGEHILSASSDRMLTSLMADFKDDLMGAAHPVRFGQPIVSLRESVTSKTSQTVITKSPNKHGRVYMEAEPLGEQLCNAIDALEIHRDQDMKVRARALADNFGWDVTEARKIWSFGCPPEGSANLFVDLTKGVQFVGEIKDATAAAFQMATANGVLCEEPMRGIRFNLVDTILQTDAIHRGAGQVMPTVRRALYGCQLIASPVLLEPIYLNEVNVPQTATGGVYATLSARRGMVEGLEERPGSAVVRIRSFVPAAESFGFDELMRKNTSGTAVSSLLFSHWAQVPGDPLQSGTLANEMLMKTRKRKGLKEAPPEFSDYYDKMDAGAVTSIQAVDPNVRSIPIPIPLPARPLPGSIGSQIRVALLAALMCDTPRTRDCSEPAIAIGLPVPPLIEIVAQYVGDGLHTVDVDELRGVMNTPERVRNVAFVGCTDAGKSLLVDCLVRGAGILSKDGDIRFMDTRTHQTTETCTTRAIAASLHFALEVSEDGYHRCVSGDRKSDSSAVSSNSNSNSSSVVPHLVNVIDTPGDLDRSGDVSAAMRVSDGAVFVVDPTNGGYVPLQLDTALHAARRERVKPVLFFNKLDRILMPAANAGAGADLEVAYHTFAGLLDACNTIIATYQDPNDAKVYDAEFLSPSRGNVAFGSSADAWGFTLDRFALMYMKKFGMPKREMVHRLWGDSFYDAKTKSWSDRVSAAPAAIASASASTSASATKAPDAAPSSSRLRGFVQFVLRPIATVMDTVLTGTSDAVAAITQKLGIVIPKTAAGLSGKALLRVVMQSWLPASDAVLELVVNHLPSPKTAQPYRVDRLYTGRWDDRYATAIRTCDPKGPLMICVCKLMPSSSVPGQYYAFGRVFSGTVTNGQAVQVRGPNFVPNGRSEVTAHTAGTVLMMGRFTEVIADVPAGGFVGLVGVDSGVLRSATVANEPNASNFAAIQYAAAPVVQMTVTVQHAGDHPKLVAGLQKLSKSLVMIDAFSAPSGEHILAGGSETIVTVARNELRDYHVGGIPLRFSEPYVVARETVTTQNATAVVSKSPNKHNRIYMRAQPMTDALCAAIETRHITSGQDLKTRGAQLCGVHGWDKTAAQKVWTFGNDADGAAANVLVDATRNVTYLYEVKDSMIAALLMTSPTGVLCEEPMRAIRFDLEDFFMNSDSIHRSAGQIIPTTRRAMYACQLAAGPALLEPVYKIEIITPLSQLASVYGVFVRLRATVESENELTNATASATDSKTAPAAAARASTMVQVTGLLPVRESFGIRQSLSHLATPPQFIFSHWAAVPGDPCEDDSRAGEWRIQIRTRKGLPAAVPPFDQFNDKV